jgi:small subunit ribosomal protein S10e
VTAARLGWAPQVIKLMQSLASRGYVRKSYTWNHHYYFLTNEGLTYLREYLSLPESIVPKTHMKQQVRSSSRPGGDGDRGDRPRFDRPRGDRPEGGGFGRGRGGDREGYRSGPKDPSSFGGDAPRFGGRGRGGDAAGAAPAPTPQ